MFRVYFTNFHYFSQREFLDTRCRGIGAFLYAVGDKYVFSVAALANKTGEAIGNLDGIMALFAKAKKHLRFPTIVLHVKGHSEGVRISIAGDLAKVPGSLTITSQNRAADDRRTWFGRVLSNGTFEPAQAATAAITDHLRAFAADPAKAAADHGRLTGKCCFCNTKLTDERSTAVGYGQTCADHFGLDWGNRPTSFAEAA